ncbi:hypothetical protein SGCZBJ_05890 [Caulobacter zeae]|uniref:Uncharacterized protein n=1 Tax=Caulobacter zeae TaxID=2055137 RepID=A0A2N5DPC1_9CAUL|nr:hypothetical protein [Caulobacter zeae]PLR27884.1 hypothetical protein SGCZBJ_05890 [Caulobacter zeae]
MSQAFSYDPENPLRVETRSETQARVLQGAAWIGLLLVVMLDPDRRGLIAFVIAAALLPHLMLLGQDAPDAPRPGLWRTSRDGRRRIWIVRVRPLMGLATSLFVTARFWWYGEIAGVAGGLACAALHLLSLPFSWRAPVSRDELEIDASGLTSAALARRMGWNEVAAISPRLAADKGALRLILTSGEEVMVDLSAVGVSREPIVAFIETLRPGLLDDAPLDLSGPSVAARIASAESEPPAFEGPPIVRMTATLLEEAQERRAFRARVEEGRSRRRGPTP